MKITWLLIVLLLSQIGCTIFPNKYSAEEIEAWVVDADTGEPLEDVIVVAAWELRGGLELGNPVGNANLMETVTDKKGRFYFPAWGPVWKRGALSPFDAPNLYLFKRDYKHEILSNRFSSSPCKDKNSVCSSDWHGKIIKMKKFQGSLEEYARSLLGLDISIGSVIGIYDKNMSCEWTKIPKMLAEIFRLRKLLAEENMYNPLMRIDSLPTNEQCSSPQIFFKEYLVQ